MIPQLTFKALCGQGCLYQYTLLFSVSPGCSDCGQWWEVRMSPAWSSSWFPNWTLASIQDPESRENYAESCKNRMRSGEEPERFCVISTRWARQERPCGTLGSVKGAVAAVSLRTAALKLWNLVPNEGTAFCLIAVPNECRTFSFWRAWGCQGLQWGSPCLMKFWVLVNLPSQCDGWFFVMDFAMSTWW